MEEDLMKLKGDHHLSSKELMPRLWEYVKPHWKSFLLGFILIIFNVALDIITPIFNMKITDYLAALTPHSTLLYIVSLAVGLFICVVTNQALLYIETMVLQKTGQKIIYSLRLKVFEHIENMSEKQFGEMPVGALVTRVANYTANMSDLFTTTLVTMIRNLLSVLGVYIIMFVLNVKLTAILSCVVVVVIIISIIFHKRINVLFAKERGCLSDLNAFLNENLSGMKITQIFNQEKRKLKEFDEKNDAHFKAEFKVVQAFAAYRPSITFLYFASMILTFALGIQPWINLTAGTIIAFYLYLSRFFTPVQNLADQLNALARARTASERLFNLLDVEPDVIDGEDSIEIDHFEGKIEFRDVWFAYRGDNYILRGINFVIEPRQTVAFVGATGSGKTTILSLIVRNYEPQKGHIYIDDIDIRKIKIDSLRKKIGQMLQDVFLFTGSIRSNITLHDDSFSEERINEVCQYVNADRFIAKLPNKLDEQVIERGENMSQGQRQLLSFARTVIHDPEILILDEATSNIDTETEVLIQDSLDRIKNIGTMLIVAHRLSTIQKSDQIFVLYKGEVVERGTHQELLAQKGQYYKLYLLQFDGETNE